MYSIITAPLPRCAARAPTHHFTLGYPRDIS
jgi:hypothetical protein